MQKIISRLLALTVLAGSLSFAQPSHAAMYSVDGNFGGYQLDTTITTSNALDAVGGYDITGMTGSISGFGNIASVVPNPNQPNYCTDAEPPGSGGADLTANNVWAPTDPHLLGGVVFLMQNGLTGLLWENNSGTFNLYLGAYNIYSTNQVASVSEVPLPASGVMTLAAAGMIALFVILKKRGSVKV